ncbi:MAG: PhoH family protein [Rhodobacteraceae bacterium]|nr:PhoH family protein [Paracoccaceae bacterium]
MKFPDNRLLIDLCGEFDKNLAEIEQRLTLQIVRRGNELNLFGDEISRSDAKIALEAMYTRLENGKSLDNGDIDRELRKVLGVKDLERSKERDKQIEMFKKSGFEIRTRKKVIEPRTDAQKAFASSLLKNELAFGIGPAGTGKTYLAVAVAVSKFINGEVDRIVLSRPAVEAGEKLGYLPGDMKDKVDPYMQPLYDALNDFLPGKQLSKLIEEKRIEIAPLAFMRGRTLSHAFVVLDEAQNASSMQMKMFLTRLGEGSRMAITGDKSQIDLPKGALSGLVEAERLLSSEQKISFNYFSARDVVRHPLVASIIEAYDADSKKKLNSLKLDK